ncbi:uncharacterized protein RCC_08708 [Ramularia collo-cygni]|uniref:Uncharacterized protein n=1 Tax=Ramularia collo-cygni TaxID=112498 RepID=A0A2D3V7W5_9PEZI|nr:uncharacterized protein RCC_08708 [Ramularia collo-cygni]CZT23000.1 uncharacterized protein RCC_08708 [Ramularia collo-cygni]
MSARLRSFGKAIYTAHGLSSQLSSISPAAPTLHPFPPPSTLKTKQPTNKEPSTTTSKPIKYHPQHLPTSQIDPLSRPPPSHISITMSERSALTSSTRRSSRTIASYSDRGGRHPHPPLNIHVSDHVAQAHRPINIYIGENQPGMQRRQSNLSILSALGDQIDVESTLPHNLPARSVTGSEHNSIAPPSRIVEVPEDDDGAIPAPSVFEVPKSRDILVPSGSGSHRSISTSPGPPPEENIAAPVPGASGSKPSSVHTASPRSVAGSEPQRTLSPLPVESGREDTRPPAPGPTFVEHIDVNHTSGRSTAGNSGHGSTPPVPATASIRSRSASDPAPAVQTTISRAVTPEPQPILPEYPSNGSTGQGSDTAIDALGTETDDQHTSAKYDATAQVAEAIANTNLKYTAKGILNTANREVEIAEIKARPGWVWSLGSDPQVLHRFSNPRVVKPYSHEDAYDDAMSALEREKEQHFQDMAARKAISDAKIKAKQESVASKFGSSSSQPSNPQAGTGDAAPAKSNAGSKAPSTGSRYEQPCTITCFDPPIASPDCPGPNCGCIDPNDSKEADQIRAFLKNATVPDEPPEEAPSSAGKDQLFPHERYCTPVGASHPGGSGNCTRPDLIRAIPTPPDNATPAIVLTPAAEIPDDVQHVSPKLSARAAGKRAVPSTSSGTVRSTGSIVRNGSPSSSKRDATDRAFADERNPPANVLENNQEDVVISGSFPNGQPRESSPEGSKPPDPPLRSSAGSARAASTPALTPTVRTPLPTHRSGVIDLTSESAGVKNHTQTAISKATSQASKVRQQAVESVTKLDPRDVGVTVEVPSKAPEEDVTIHSKGPNVTSAAGSSHPRAITSSSTHPSQNDPEAKKFVPQAVGPSIRIPLGPPRAASLPAATSSPPLDPELEEVYAQLEDFTVLLDTARRRARTQDAGTQTVDAEPTSNVGTQTIDDPERSTASKRSGPAANAGVVEGAPSRPDCSVNREHLPSTTGNDDEAPVPEAFILPSHEEDPEIQATKAPVSIRSREEVEGNPESPQSECHSSRKSFVIPQPEVWPPTSESIINGDRIKPPDLPVKKQPYVKTDPMPLGSYCPGCAWHIYWGFGAEDGVFSPPWGEPFPVSQDANLRCTVVKKQIELNAWYHAIWNDIVCAGCSHSRKMRERPSSARRKEIEEQTAEIQERYANPVGVNPGERHFPSTGKERYVFVSAISELEDDAEAHGAVSEKAGSHVPGGSISGPEPVSQRVHTPPFIELKQRETDDLPIGLTISDPPENVVRGGLAEEYYHPTSQSGRSDAGAPLAPAGTAEIVEPTPSFVVTAPPQVTASTVCGSDANEPPPAPRTEVNGGAATPAAPSSDKVPKTQSHGHVEHLGSHVSTRSRGSRATTRPGTPSAPASREKSSSGSSSKTSEKPPSRRSPTPADRAISSSSSSSSGDDTVAPAPRGHRTDPISQIHHSLRPTGHVENLNITVNYKPGIKGNMIINNNAAPSSGGRTHSRHGSRH